MRFHVKALAEMDPSRGNSAIPRCGLPRTGGDAPRIVRDLFLVDQSTPHAQGYAVSAQSPLPVRRVRPARSGDKLPRRPPHTPESIQTIKMQCNGSKDSRCGSGAWERKSNIHVNH